MVHRYQRPKPSMAPEIPYAWSQPRNKDTGQQQIRALLEAAAENPIYDGNHEVWDHVLEMLNLAICYQPAVAMVLREGRWRDKQNPKAYIATAAARQGLRMHLPDYGDREFKVVVGAKYDVDGERGPDISVDRHGNDKPISDLERFDVRTHGAIAQKDRDENAMPKIPEWLQHPREYDRVNWQTVARFAALKPRMVPALALTLKLRHDRHLTREAAVAEAKITHPQHDVEAAWKWIDRNWEARIVPLFQMDEAPQRTDKPKPPKRGSAAFIPPWKAIQNACERRRRYLASLF